MACFIFLVPDAHSYEVNKKAVKKWFQQHDYLFTDSFFSGEQWVKLSYTEKYDLVEEYFLENELNVDVRKSLLTLDLMFHLDEGIYKPYSVYAILDKIIAEMFRDEASTSFYTSTTQ